MDGFILIINTGNTSTKVGLYENGQPAVVEAIKHSDEDLAGFDHINSQMNFRENVVLEFLASHDVPVERIVAVAARGGLLRPVESGTYLVNDRLLQDLREGKRGMHASHLSAQIGSEIARRAGCSCYVVDPISVDEFEPIARYSGHKLFERVMLTHALNMKAVVRRFARDQDVDHRNLTVIVVHLGTGISVAVHRKGRMIDADNLSRQLIYPDHPLGFTITGDETRVQSFTQAMLREHHARHYNAANCVLAFSGDVDPGRAIELANKYFSRMPRGERVTTIAPEHAQRHPRFELVENVSSQTELRVCYRAVPDRSEMRPAMDAAVNERRMLRAGLRIPSSRPKTARAFSILSMASRDLFCWMRRSINR